MYQKISFLPCVTFSSVTYREPYVTLCHILTVGSQQDKKPATRKDFHANYVTITKLM